jgi:hypothetical protein
VSGADTKQPLFFKRTAALQNRRAFQESRKKEELLGVKPELGLSTLRIGTGLALRSDGWRFKGAQTTYFLHDSFGFHFGFQALESAVDWFTFSY